MSKEKPLNVQVAEALGCKVREQRRVHPEYPHKIQGPIDSWHCGCAGLGEHAVGYTDASYGDPWFDTTLKDYDTDWAATGPLIEKYSFRLGRMAKAVSPPLPGDTWIAHTPAWEPSWWGEGPTPLIAVCTLILRLAANGQLRAA